MSVSQFDPENQRPATKSTPPSVGHVSRKMAEDAVRTILAYYGEDPQREGLIDTPRRVIDAYHEYFSGYTEDPNDILSRTFENKDDYDQIVLMKDIRFSSHCEHHIQPIVGVAHVAYLPSERVVGISKLARIVDVYSQRLQNQESLTKQIATAIQQIVKPRGVAVLINAEHYCLSKRGVRKENVSCVTQVLLGEFSTDPTKSNLFANIL